MKEIIVKLYEFSELPEEIQQKVIENNRDINIDDYWHDLIIDEWKVKLEEQGFTEPKIYFSGFCSQGDGACFECKSIDVKKYIKSHNLEKKYHRISDYLSDYVKFYIDKNSYGNHYSHSNTRYVDIEFTNYSNKEHPLIDKLTVELKSHMEETRKDISDTIYRELEKEYEYQTTDEAIKETIEANEYTFEISGRMNNG